MSVTLVEESVQDSKLSDRPDSQREPFHIFASIRPFPLGTEVVIPNEVLDGEWKIALKELSFVRTLEPFARPQPLQFLIATPVNEGCVGYGDYLLFLNDLKGIESPSFGKLAGRLENTFSDFPGAAVFTALYSDGTTVMLPCGQKPLENFIAETNKVLQRYFSSHADRIKFNGIKIKLEADHIAISWDTAKGVWDAVHVFPLFNEDIGSILGIPPLYSTDFLSIVIEAMKNKRNVTIPRNDIIKSQSDFIIQCSIVKHNSNVVGPWEEGGLDPLNNRILRFVSQANLQKYSNGQPVRISFDNDLFYVPVRTDSDGDCKTSETRFRIRVLMAETMKPINMDGKLNLTFHFTPDTGSVC